MTTVNAPHLNPELRHDIVVLLDVRDGNPNGDPDAGNAPRTDPQTMQGLITDGALKRKVRDTLAAFHEDEPGYDLYVQHGVALEAQNKRAFTSTGLKPGEADTSDVRAWLCRTFVDIRLFGAVLASKNADAGKVQGPMQMTFARSIDPIMPVENGITRVTQTRQADIDKGETTEMGTKWTVPYGLYRSHAFFSPRLAAKTGVTSTDLANFWRALTLMCDQDRTSSRGEMSVRGLYVFTHPDKYGTAPAHTLFEQIDVARQDDTKPARAFADYNVTINTAAVPSGITLTRLVG